MNETKSPYMQQSRHDDGRMTREQAVKWVKFVHDVLYEDKDEEIREALNMAIEALQTDAIPIEHHRKVLYKTVDQDIEIARLKNRIKELENG